jgi:cardiolipin synthase C
MSTMSIPWVLALACLATPPAGGVPGPGSTALDAGGALSQPGSRSGSLQRAFESLPGTAVGAPPVTLLSGNPDAWAARWRLLEGARTSIDASYFIFERDLFGLAFLGHLYARAEQGVQVKLMIDGRGSGPFALPLLGLDDLQELVDTGNADVRVYNAPYDKIVTSVLQGSAVPAAASSHNKILVVDGSRAVVGGRNLSACYFTDIADNPCATVDADVLLEGAEAAAALARIVERERAASAAGTVRADTVNWVSKREGLLMMFGAMDAWLKGSVPKTPREEAVFALEAAALAPFRRLPERRVRDQVRPYLSMLAALSSHHGILARSAPAAAPVDEARVVAGASRAERQDDEVNDALVRSIAAAERQVTIESPYFMMTPRFLGALQQASRRGVEIIVLTNSFASSDNIASQALLLDTWPELAARIPTLRLFVGAKPPMLHAKRMIIDGELTLIGSHNFDPLSAHLNSEVVVGIRSRAVARRSLDVLEARLWSGQVYEYRIARDENGRARRHSRGHPRQGEVVVLYGPRNHLPASAVADLERLKRLLIGIRGIWDFSWVVW